MGAHERVILTTLEIIQYYLNKDFLFICKDGKAFIDKIYGVYILDDGRGSFGLEKREDYYDEVDFKRVLPILKHTSAMPNDAAVYDMYYKLCKRMDCGNIRHVADTPHSLIFAINHGYDVFDLIETGKAVIVNDLSKYKITTLT